MSLFRRKIMMAAKADNDTFVLNYDSGDNTNLAQRYIGIGNIGDVSVEATAVGMQFCDSGGNVIGSTASVGASAVNYAYFTDATGQIKIPSASIIRRLYVRSGYYDLGQFSKCAELREFWAYGEKITGDLSVLRGKDLWMANFQVCRNITGDIGDVGQGHMYRISMPYCSQITGDVTDIADELGLTTCDLRGCPLLTGTAEQFIEEQLANGRNSGTLYLWTTASNITFNGEVRTDMYIEYSSGTVNVYSDSAKTDLIATFDGTTWTYN